MITETAVTTILHSYRFDLQKPGESQAYAVLCRLLRDRGSRCMAAHAPYNGWTKEYISYWDAIKALDGQELLIDTAYLFADQLNTAPIPSISESGLIVHDWAETIFDNKSMKWGYWLELSPSLREARRNTVVCGYCGKQEPAASGSVFCPRCLDSEYLKSTELRLTRMVPVEDERKVRPPLTEAESAYLLPLYRDAQVHGSTERGKARIAKARRDILTKRDTALSNARAEYEGMLWLMDHGWDTRNVIYYDHTGRFGFGWRTPLSDDMVSALLDIITEFPFPYDIQGTSRTLSGER